MNNLFYKCTTGRKYFNDVEINEFTEYQLETIDNVLSSLEQEEFNKSIQGCIELLLSKDSFLFTLYYFEGLTLDQISKIVHLAANNVKVKIFRSRKKIASILKGKLEP